jgi:hypothetical protein
VRISASRLSGNEGVGGGNAARVIRRLALTFTLVVFAFYFG